MNLSAKAQIVIGRIVLELCECKYGYRTIVSGAYDACIYNYGLEKPEETTDVIVDGAIDILTQTDNTD